MTKDGRRAKVTPESKEEADRLAKLWATRSHPSQAEFGETYGIGNQSAVGQFLRGETPLSLKAARGFAIGLGCNIEDFSPRLAKEAAAIASMVPGEALDPAVAQLAAAINALNMAQRKFVIGAVQTTLEFARENIGRTDAQKENGGGRENSTGSRKAA
jgi:hypothetical protein